MRNETIKTISGAIGFGISGLSWLTYSGPYKWMVEIQVQTIGEYYPMWSFLLPGLLFAFVIERVWSTFAKNDPAECSKSTNVWMRQKNTFYQLAGGASGLAVVAGWMLIPVWTSNSEIEQVDLAQIEQGTAPEYSWVSVSGRMLWDECVVEEDGALETYYVPLVSENWNEGDEVFAFVELNQTDANKLWEEESATFDGMLQPGGLTSFYRTYFEELDEIKIAETTIYLDNGITPGFNRNVGLVCLTGCWLLGMGSIFCFNSTPIMTTETPTVPTPPSPFGIEPPAFQPGGEVVATPEPAGAGDVDEGVLNWMKERGIDHGATSQDS